jgi:ABC-type amino acid transport substrate-binding protein
MQGKQMRFLLKVLILLIVLNPQVLLAGQRVKMATFQLEPYMMRDAESKAVVGIAIDYWKEFIAPELGVDLEITGIYPPPRAMKMLEEGKVDVAPLFTKIPEREALFLFPETSLTEIISCLVVRKDSPLKEVNTPEDLYGMTLGFVKTAYIPPMLINDKIAFDMISSENFRQMNVDKLISKRIDALLDINYVSLMYFLKKRGYLDQVRTVSLPTETVGVYSIFRKTEAGTALRDAFEKVNRKGHEGRVFEKIAQKYLN